MSIDTAAEWAPMSPVTWAKVERGQPVHRITYAGIEQSLQWAPGSVNAYLRGGAEPHAIPQGQADADVIGLAKSLTELLGTLSAPAVSLIKAMLDEAYQRGRRDALAGLATPPSSSVSISLAPPPPPGPPQAAPHELARAQRPRMAMPV